MEGEFQDAFCDVSVAMKCTQVREVMRLVFLFVYYRMPLLIACGIHSLQSIALCAQVGDCYPANVIVFDFYREYSFLLLWHLCMCVRVCV